jgi:hypothetical protein
LSDDRPGRVAARKKSQALRRCILHHAMFVERNELRLLSELRA